jgi:protein gp37
VSDKSAIEWTDATWNPTRGCTKIAQGCKNCYAETFAERWRGVPNHAYELGFDPRLAPDQLHLPLTWKKPRRIFVDSMSDLFHEEFPFTYIAAVFGVMGACQRHTFQVLTKRPERAVQFFAWLEKQRPEFTAAVVKLGGAWPNGQQSAQSAICAYYARDVLEPITESPFAGWPLPNVWIGTSVANQCDADKNIPELLRIPAAVRFLSIEPMLGPVDLSELLSEDWQDDSTHFDPYSGEPITRYESEHFGTRPVIDWVIVGGESGHGARPCNVESVRSIVAQCQAAAVPVFVKQLGANVIGHNDDGFEGDKPGSWPMDTRYEGGEFQGDPVRIRLRDKKGGDPSEWPGDLWMIRQFPKVRS